MSNEVIYANISGENERKNQIKKNLKSLIAYVIESLCTACEDNGTTTILLTKIPFFQEVILLSFYCEHCGNRNNEVQFGGKLADQGVVFTLTVTELKDLDRQCIKAEHASIRIPEVDFEIPPNKKANVNTIEGFLVNIIKDLEQLQPLRHVQVPEQAVLIDAFLVKLRNLKEGNGFPFTLILQDPAGNSFIQNLVAPKTGNQANAHDPHLKIKHYNRTVEEMESMGYSVENTKQEIKQEKEQVQEKKEQQEEEAKHQPQQTDISAMNHDFSKPMIEDPELRQESLKVPCYCNVCGLEGEQKFCTVSVPHFSDLMIMAFQCEHCGAKDTEVKSGGAIPEQGQLLTLKVKNETDLKRDVYKSQNASLEIPEIELELTYGTLGGVYTSVEGILEKVLDNLKKNVRTNNNNNPFAGDSDNQFKKRMNQLFMQLKNLKTGTIPFTLILRDPSASSFIQNPNHPNADPQLIEVKYKRTEEEDEYLGIDLMKTEDYQ